MWGIMSTFPVPPLSLTEAETSWRQDHLWRVHSYIGEMIRFADAKAGFTLAVSGAVLGALVALDQTPGHGLREAWRWPQWCCLLAYLLLATSAVAGAWCVRPRLRGAPGKGFVFWKNIAAFHSHADFAREFFDQPQVALDQQLAESVHDLALICETKYRFLEIAVFTGIAGSLLGALALLTM